MVKHKKAGFFLIFFVGFMFFSCNSEKEPVYRVEILVPSGSVELKSVAEDVRYIAEEFYRKRIENNPVFKEKGFSVVFDYIDTQADAAITVDRMRAAIIHNPDIIAFLGPMLSRTAIPAAEIADQAGIPMISSMATHPAVTQNRGYVFAMLPDDLLEIRAIVRFIRERLKKDKAVVLYEPGDDYSRDMSEYFKRVFPAAGGEITGLFAVNVANYSYIASLADADTVVFAPLFGNSLAAAYSAMRDAGYKGAFVGGDSWASLDEPAKSLVEGFFAFFWDGAFYESASSDFFKEIAADKKGLDERVYNPVFCDSLFFLLSGLEKMQLSSPKGLRDALASHIGGRLNEFKGILGVYKMDKIGKIMKKIYIYVRKNGEDSLVTDMDPLE